MDFVKHKELEGSHAFLSASSHSWLNYDTDRLIKVYSNYKAAQRGTELHAFAATCIKLGQPLPATEDTLNLYVNDAIKYRMSPEVVLYYSPNCYGTTDAICFRDGLLRIHDLKTGVLSVKMDQLLIYASMFCLEYGIDPYSISFELRIYQANEYRVANPTSDEVNEVMQKIVYFDSVIEKLKAGELTQ